MNTHDTLAYAIAAEAVRRVRAESPPWKGILSSESYVTTSRSWPVPDFVIHDERERKTIAVEFKPPEQTKREYLTGVGQAVAYTREFTYGIVVLPDFADDGFPIARHVRSIFSQKAFSNLPVGLLSYDPRMLSPQRPGFCESHFFSSRIDEPESPAALDQSFYGKWREQSPEEMSLLLQYSYDAMRAGAAQGVKTVRDEAFDRLWQRIQSGEVRHWGGGVRHYDGRSRTAVGKNYRNFLFHIGWTVGTGELTKEGLDGLHTSSLYGASSRPFLDCISRAVLLSGKHLVLFNAISEYQDQLYPVPEEAEWLNGLELFLEEKGLLRRNIGRKLAARAGSVRQFLKAEKQLWKNLELIVPRGPAGSRVFHPGRGFIFNWSRITELLG